MKTKILETAKNEDVILLNRLTRLLEEQINIVLHSDITGKKVDDLIDQTQLLVKEIAQKHLLRKEQFAEQREHIKRLFNNLNLAVIAQKNETEKQLNHVRKGKKTIDAYQRNILANS